MAGSVSERAVTVVSISHWYMGVRASKPSMGAGAAMATAARREKRAITTFILQVLKERLESAGDRGMTLTRCDEQSDYRKYPELGKGRISTTSDGSRFVYVCFSC